MPSAVSFSGVRMNAQFQAKPQVAFGAQSRPASRSNNANECFTGAVGCCGVVAGVGLLAASFVPYLQYVSPFYWAYRGVKTVLVGGYNLIAGGLGRVKRFFTETIPGWFGRGKKAATAPTK